MNIRDLFLRAISIFILLTSYTVYSYADLRAFPGAEGFGAYATGGRSGEVLIVTNLNAEGPGSLQEALNQTYPRIVTFAVSGVIDVQELRIPYGDLTIAGQTAPGAGITIEGRIIADYGGNANNIIVRHIRVRPKTFSNQSDGAQFDAIQFGNSRNVILDHISVAFGVDETIDIYNSKNVTVQWSSIEMSATEGHPESNHNYGLINGPQGGNVSIHHNIFAHHNKRAPALSVGPAETINNVIYNVKDAWVHHNPARGQFVIENNTFIEGPSAKMLPFFLDAESIDNTLQYYIQGNLFDSTSYTGTIDPWPPHPDNTNLIYACSYFNGGNCEDYKVDTKPTWSSNTHVPVSLQSQKDSYQSVMELSGAFPRDIVTQTVISEINDRSGTWGARIPADLLQDLSPASPPTDADGDGMNDAWETTHNLNPNDGSDHKTTLSSGYTAIEEYINQLATRLIQGDVVQNAKPNPPGNLRATVTQQ